MVLIDIPKISRGVRMVRDILPKEMRALVVKGDYMLMGR